MDKLMAALRKQLEFMIDDEENEFDSFGQIDGEPTFGVTDEDGNDYFITVEEG